MDSNKEVEEREMVITILANGLSNTTLFITSPTCFSQKSTTIRVVIELFKKEAKLERKGTH